MAMQLPTLREVERLSPRVIRILGGNPGKFTLQGTNTYLIGLGPQRLLLDTGEGKPSWLSALKGVLSSESASINTAILTHWHADHVDGVNDLLSLSPSTKIYKNKPTYNISLPGFLDIADGQKFTTQGATLRAVHCPGHTEDHMAFILEEEDAMFTGDNVLGHGTAVFEDLGKYMGSLEVIAGMFGGRAYPGHGDLVEDGRGKVLEYISHRRQREREVLAVLERERESDGADTVEGWTPMEIVKVVYRDYPESLHLPAQGGVVQILEKLRREGSVVEEVGSNRWRLKSKSAL